MDENAGNGDEKQINLSWSEPTESATKAPQSPPVAPTAHSTPAVPAPVNASSMSTARLVGMVVVGIVLGVVVAWAWVALRSSSGTVAASENENATSTSATGTGSSNTFSVASPQFAGKSVAIEKAEVSAPTWVVVYEDRDGKPGNALGAALFFPSRDSGSVELLRATMPGKTYLIAKQVDNGDRKFSLKNDQLVSENGVVQWVTLEVK